MVRTGLSRKSSLPIGIKRDDIASFFEAGFQLHCLGSVGTSWIVRNL
jgi:hypothetical protein